MEQPEQSPQVQAPREHIRYLYDPRIAAGCASVSPVTHPSSTRITALPTATIVMQAHRSVPHLRPHSQ